MLETVKRMNEARDDLLAHPMCGKLVETKGRVVVMFPLGYSIEAAQMRYKQQGVSRTKALELLLNTCEKYWRLGLAFAS